MGTDKYGATDYCDCEACKKKRGVAMNDELNEQVAEQIMGWTRPANKFAEGDEYHPLEEWARDGCWQAPGGTYHLLPPDYSGDWAAFGSLLEYLTAKSRVERWPPIAMLVGTNFGRANVYGTGRVKATDIRQALCQAALKAKEEAT